MFVSGDPLRSPGPRGEQQHDKSFMIWLHAGADPIEICLPVNQWVHEGEIVISTDPAHEEGKPVVAGETLTLAGRSVLVLRQS